MSEEDSSVKDEIVDNKNKQDVHCRFCNSLILKEKQGTYERKQVGILYCQKNTFGELLNIIKELGKKASKLMMEMIKGSSQSIQIKS